MRQLLLMMLVALCAAPAYAQDPVKVDPKHYKVELENSKVRVLRIHYEPHAKSAMHSHPDSVVVVLTDATTKMGLPDGKSQTMTMKAGQTMFAPAGSHLPENIGDKPFEIIQVELKGGAAKSGAANPAPKK